MRVFVYNLMFNKMGGVTRACRAIGAEIVNISGDDLHKSIEYIIGAGNNPAPGMDSDEDISELLIFEGFSSENLDDFLDAYKGTQAPTIEYKAMLTPINIKWSPAYLYSHLRSEINK